MGGQERFIGLMHADDAVQKSEQAINQQGAQAGAGQFRWRLALGIRAQQGRQILIHLLYAWQILQLPAQASHVDRGRLTEKNEAEMVSVRQPEIEHGLTVRQGALGLGYRLDVGSAELRGFLNDLVPDDGQPRSE